MVDSSGKAQMQPVLHGGRPAPQLPPHVKFLDSVRSWRAETVPAQRTAAIMSTGNIFRKAFMLRSCIDDWEAATVLLLPLLKLRRTELSRILTRITAPKRERK